MAGAATVALLSTNARWVFSSLREGVRALIAFTLVYTTIYFLLRAEGAALLIGAIISFLTVTAALYLTRKTDWYGHMPVPQDPA